MFTKSFLKIQIYILLDKTKNINEVTQLLYGILSQINVLTLNESIEVAKYWRTNREISK